MIRLLNLYLKDFMNIGEATFDFDHSVIMLAGKSASGKSAVLDAISLCLSNKKRASSYADYVMQNKPFAKVVLECLIHNKPVKFDLQINLKSGTPYQMTLYYNDKEYKNTEADEVIESFDLEYYSDIIFSMQGDNDITKLTPSQRLTYLQRLLNFDFDEEKEYIKTKQAKVKQLITECETKIEVTNQLIEQQSGSINNIDESLILSEEDIVKLQDQILSLEEQLIFINNKNELELKLAKLQTNKSNTEFSISTLNQSKRVLEGKLKNVGTQIEEQEKNNADILNLEKQNESLSNMLSTQLESEKTYTETKIDNINNVIIKLMSDKKIINEKQKLVQLGQCPTCGQHTSNIDSDNNIEQFLNTIENELTQHNEQLNSLKLRNTELTQQISNIRSTIRQNAILISDKKKVIFETNGSKYEEDLYRLDNEIDKFESTLVTIQNDIDSVERELSAFVDTGNVTSSSIQKQILDIHKQIETSKKLLATKEEQKVLTEQRMNILSKEQDTLKSLNNDKSVFDDAYNILDKSLPLYMIKKVCDNLESQINEFIRTIFGSYKVVFDVTKKGCEFLYTKDDNIKEDKHKNNHLLNAKMSSGFEKALLTMSFKTALLKCYGINIFIGDEIDGAADEDSSLQLFSNLFNNSYFDQVFLISHKKSICQSITSEVPDTVVYFANNGQFTSSIRADYGD